MNATISRKNARPKPPDKGSFPLDHEGECKEYMKRFMQCLKESKNDNHECRSQSQQYLQCRMERGLMKREEFRKLGYSDDEVKQYQ